MEKRGIKIAAQNRKAYHDYSWRSAMRRHRAGRDGGQVHPGRAGESEGFLLVAKDGELFALSMHISPYEQGNIFNKDPDRPSGC